MSQCDICQHAKVDAIHAALDAQRLRPMIARAFRVNLDVLIQHIAHRSSNNQGLSVVQVSKNLETDVFTEVIIERPLIRFKQAWQDAKDDPQEQQRMVLWLNDQLQSEDMGA